MANFTRKTIDLSAEQDLTIGMITNDGFAAQLAPHINVSLFQNDALAHITAWCIEYFDDYEKAPGMTIQALYDRRQAELPESLRDIINQTLSNLSNRFEQHESFNLDYMLNKSRDYLSERRLRKQMDEAISSLDGGDVKKASHILAGAVSQSDVRSMPFSPLTKGYATKVAMSTDDSYLFKMPGAVGTLIGPFKRKWFVCYQGVAKRGKTYELLHVTHSALRANLKVYYADMEMDEEETLTRLYQMMTLTTRGQQGTVAMPVFDCKKNQDGSCDLPCRTQSISLLYNDENDKPKKPPFNPDLPYRVCTACRFTSDDYEEATWFVEKQIDEYTSTKAERHNIRFGMHHGNNLRMNTYPKFGATLSDILADIDYLGITEGWYPDVLVFDYADILKPETYRGGDPREAVNDTWKAISREAGQRKILIVSATQGNRGGFKQVSMDEEGVSEDIRKLANVNVLIALNQTPAEKKMGVMRQGLMVHRHKEFHQYRQAKVLYNREMGAIHLDSEIVDVSINN